MGCYKQRDSKVIHLQQQRKGSILEQQERSKPEDSGFEVEFYMSEDNQSKLIHADDVNNFSKYG